MRWLGITSLEEVLYRVNDVIRMFGKRLEALIVFGSTVYSPRRARDLDLMVIVDSIIDVSEKTVLELEIRKALRNTSLKPIDVIVFDVGMLKENLEPGAIASGLIAGYIAVLDRINIPQLLSNVLEKLAQEDVVIMKRSRKLNLSAIARVKTYRL